MAVPTEVLNDDVKALREDLHQVELSLTKSIESVRHDVGKLQAEFGLAKWLLGLILVTTMTATGSGIWWASSTRLAAPLQVTRFFACLTAILPSPRSASDWASASPRGATCRPTWPIASRAVSPWP